MWPFDIVSSFDPKRNIPDLSGKVILVTGGNNGLGRETVLQLARHNPKKIFLASRSEQKGRDAIKLIQNEIESSKQVAIEYLPLDLSSLPSVAKAAEEVKSKSDRLDVLILNAGIMSVPPAKTDAGFEIQLATNFIGHFLLTKSLLPLLQTTAKQQSNADVRIVSVSSEGNSFAPAMDVILDTEKLYQSGPAACYGASKAGNIMLASEFARRYTEITSVSLHPGTIQTDLFVPGKEGNWIIRWGARFIGPLVFQTVESGALNQLWLGFGTKKEGLQSGAYYTPVGQKTKNKYTERENSEKLWDWTEKELAKRGY